MFYVCKYENSYKRTYLLKKNANTETFGGMIYAHGPFNLTH